MCAVTNKGWPKRVLAMHARKFTRRCALFPADPVDDLAMGFAVLNPSSIRSRNLDSPIPSSAPLSAHSHSLWDPVEQEDGEGALYGSVRIHVRSLDRVHEASRGPHQGGAGAGAETWLPMRGTLLLVRRLRWLHHPRGAGRGRGDRLAAGRHVTRSHPRNEDDRVDAPCRHCRGHEEGGSRRIQRSEDVARCSPQAASGGSTSSRSAPGDAYVRACALRARHHCVFLAMSSMTRFHLRCSPATKARTSAGDMARV